MKGNISGTCARKDYKQAGLGGKAPTDRVSNVRGLEWNIPRDPNSSAAAEKQLREAVAQRSILMEVPTPHFLPQS